MSWCSPAMSKEKAVYFCDLGTQPGPQALLPRAKLNWLGCKILDLPCLLKSFTPGDCLLFLARWYMNNIRILLPAVFTGPYGSTQFLRKVMTCSQWNDVILFLLLCRWSNFKIGTFRQVSTANKCFLAWQMCVALKWDLWISVTKGACCFILIVASDQPTNGGELSFFPVI